MILSKRFFHKFIAPIGGAVERATQRYDSDKRYRMLFTRPHVNLHLLLARISNGLSCCQG